MKTDVKLQNLLSELEEGCEYHMTDGDELRPYYKQVKRQNGDIDDVYQGEIILYSAIDFEGITGQGYRDVGKIEDENDALFICTAVNALPEFSSVRGACFVAPKQHAQSCCTPPAGGGVLILATNGKRPDSW